MSTGDWLFWVFVGCLCAVGLAAGIGFALLIGARNKINRKDEP